MFQLLKSISRNEWRFIIAVILIIEILTALPPIYGALSQTPSLAYTGLHAQTSTDLTVYFSYIKQVKSGQWLVRDNFTAEPQALGTFNFCWFVVGLLARFFNLSAPLAFQLGRLLMAPGLLISLYLFLAYYFTAIKIRKLAFIFLAFASGLGVLFAPYFIITADPRLGNLGVHWWPIDLSMTEANIFSSIYQSPHLILSWTCLVLTFLFAQLAFAYRKFIEALAVGILSLIFFNFHPYYLPLVGGVLGVYGIYHCLKRKMIDWRLVGYFILAGALASVSVIYHFYLINNSYVIGVRAGQNVTRLYFWLPVLAGLGLQLPMAAAGIWLTYQKKQISDRLAFLLVWLGVSAALLVSPVQFQSRYLEGLQLPLTIFMVIAWLAIWERLEPIRSKSGGKILFNKYVLIILFIFLFGLSNIFNLARDLYYCHIRLEPLFIDRNLVLAYRWLDRLPQKDKIVLAADNNAQLVPGRSGLRVYFAHGHETIFYDQKRLATVWFYGPGNNDEQKKAWLKSGMIDYVFYSAEEKRWGELKPETKDYLRLVFDSP
jgi:hypothetical protein